MNTNNLFDNDDKNTKKIKEVGNDTKRGRILVIDLLIDIIFTILISILVMAFPFLWIIGGLSGTGLGTVAPFIGLIILVILIYIYARWKKFQKIQKNPVDIKKTRFVFSTVVVLFFIGFLVFFVNLLIKSEKSQEEYNEFRVNENIKKNEIVKKNQPAKNVKNIKVDMESKINIINKCVRGGGFVAGPTAGKYICSKHSTTNVKWNDIERWDGEWGGCEFIIEKSNNIIGKLQFCATLASGEVLQCTQKECTYVVNIK